MVDPTEAPDTTTPDPELEAKGPAPVTSAPRRSAAKKAPAKKAPAKKAPAKKAPAKKAPAKKAPAKKAAAKKAPAKKAAAKKAPAKKAPAETAPATDRPAERPPVERPAPTRPAPVSVLGASSSRVASSVPDAQRPTLSLVEPARPAAGSTAGAAGSDRFAIFAAVTQEMLNDLLLFVVGEGVALEPLETSVALPAMGDVGVRLALTVTGATVDLRAEDDGRVRLVVTADGDVSTTAEPYDGQTADAGVGAVPGAAGMPVPPAPIPVRVEALARPFVELREDGALWLGVDVRSAELVSLQTDPAAPVPDGVDPGAWNGILAMFSMLFGALGDGLFESLGEHVGAVDKVLDPSIGRLLSSLGVAEGPAVVRVASGLLSIGLPATDAVRGRALPVPIAGKRVGIAAATSVVDALSHLLVLQVVGDMPLPFELEVDLGEQHVSGRLRNARVLPSSFPDLRSSLRTQVRTRLLRGRLELSVQAAWLELPPVLPSFVNQFSRRLGELVSLAPIRVRFPARIGLPVIPDSTDTIPVEVDDLRVTADGVGIVVSLA